MAPQQLRLPAVIDLELGRHAKFHWFDPFAPDMQSRMNAIARKLVAPYRGSPYRIGYFSDNEVGWWAGALFVYYSKQPAGSYTKQRWVALLRRHYHGDWAGFAADFLPPHGRRTHGQRCWRAGQQPTCARAATASPRCANGPGSSPSIITRSPSGRSAPPIPGALYFGDRLPIYYDPAAVPAMASHVDAIAANYNVDSGDGWVARYFFDGLEKLSGGKPILFTEWFFAARENRTGNKNNGHLMTVATQAERASGAAAATLNFARIPAVVGSQWFQYYDHPKGGRPDGEDYDFGLVDTNDRPYRQLTAALGAANRRAPAIHAAAASPREPVRGAVITLPHAAIAVDDRSLAAWPKPASLLPALTPSPGAVDFGEVYLSWSDKGLAVATIGQDYFDIDLLAYDGAFPLGDAYRLELGVDAGPMGQEGGPRRVTLFFIPPRTKLKDYPPMAALLCEGAAAQAIQSGCTPVPGAEAVYFGADQPRITAEMLIPWSALGIAPPAPGASLRAEVALTSWDRERWMSLSGRAPEAALADPAGWREMRLGDGLAVTVPSPRPGAPG